MKEILWSLGLIFLIYFFSRKVAENLFFVFYKIFKNQKTAFITFSLIYLPGTLLHEISHFLTATILFLKVKEVRIFPQFEKNQIKLGGVIYEKEDPFRGFLVGISPLFFGLLFFYFLITFNLFPASNFFLNIFFSYLIFAVSSVMFSSKQDLVDLLMLLPLGFFIFFFLFFLKVDVLDLIKKTHFESFLVKFLKRINFFLLFALLVNFSLFLVLELIKRKNEIFSPMRKNCR